MLTFHYFLALLGLATSLLASAIPHDHQIDIEDIVDLDDSQIQPWAIELAEKTNTTLSRRGTEELHIFCHVFLHDTNVPHGAIDMANELLQRNCDNGQTTPNGGYIHGRDGNAVSNFCNFQPHTSGCISQNARISNDVITQNCGRYVPGMAVWLTSDKRPRVTYGWHTATTAAYWCEVMKP